MPPRWRSHSFVRVPAHKTEPARRQVFTAWQWCAVGAYSPVVLAVVVHFVMKGVVHPNLVPTRGPLP